MVYLCMVGWVVFVLFIVFDKMPLATRRLESSELFDYRIAKYISLNGYWYNHEYRSKRSFEPPWLTEKGRVPKEEWDKLVLKSYNGYWKDYYNKDMEERIERAMFNQNEDSEVVKLRKRLEKLQARLVKGGLASWKPRPKDGVMKLVFEDEKPIVAEKVK